MFSTTKLLVLFLTAASIEAIPVPKAQTPDFHSLDACPTDGSIVCSPDGGSFYLCNFGKAMPMGAVAEGMVCKNGKVIAKDSPATPSEEPAPPVVVPQPTTSMMASTPVAPKPTVAPVNPKPAPVAPVADPTTSTVTSTVETKLTSTSVILVTVTGEPPAASMTTPVSEIVPSPAPVPDSGSPISVTEDIIVGIAPDTASCANRDSFAGECRTAKQAAPFIAQSFSKYKIETVGEAAAILSIMLYESGGFQYNRNHFPEPGRPGQGTKAMLMPNFIVAYAQTFGSTDSIAPKLNAGNINDQSDDIKNKVLALVQGDDKTFGSAAWFYATNCSDSIKAGLRQSPVTIAAWQQYIEKCVVTGVEDRQAGFVAAVKGLGGSAPV
ncbi:hypothetical protein ABW20_dc0105291 [Dactylellina cionopaga]|nr:hypothetical protein ABW20_dc0105291 [Dactylellina cionopaga]